MMRWRIFWIVCMVMPLLVANANEAQTSRGTYLKLMDVQKLWETEDYAQALAELREYTSRTADKPYDNAVVHRYIAHTSILAGDPAGARNALESALSMPGLPIAFTADLKLFYGQLVLADEDFDLARRTLEDWYAVAEGKKQPEHLFSLAYANYMTQHLARAEPILAEALGGTRRPKESWYRLYYQVLFERKKYRDALLVLYGMIERDLANAAYWRLLANHFVQLEDGKEALAAMAIAHQQGMMADPDDLRRMISMFGYIEIPDKAARLLQQFVADNTIPETSETLRQLGDLWLLARERSRAKEFLQRAAAVAPDGKTYELLGSIYFEDEAWRDAYDQYLRALDLGGIGDPGRVYMLAGISAYRAGMKAEARSALREARKSAAMRRQADSLLRRLEES